MIPLAGVITQLKAGGTPFKFVGGAIDLTTAGNHLRIFPAVYVLPLADGAGPNRVASYNAVSQEMSERFGVMYAVRNVAAVGGPAGADTQEAMRTAIEWARTQVLGYQIDATRSPIEFEGGDLVSFSDEIGIWIDRWYTTRDIRKV